MKSHEPKNEGPSIEEEIDDLFQYEALIEQLKIEKQSYANKCKEYTALLQMIYALNADKLGTTIEKPFEKMTFEELRQLFKLTK